jgi:YggT family protein
LRNLTEPVFATLRRWIPFTVIGGIDLSPIIVLLAIQFIKIFVVRSLAQLGMTM